MKQLIPILLVFYIVSSCATISRPTGGPKDKIPPKLIRSNPTQQALNFKEKEVILEFNEWIALEKLQEQLIITPRIEIPYETKQRKNKLTLIFEENLPDSTTFTFNFREGIVDITEKNPWVNSVLSFSTTNYIDTAFISGIVWNYFKNEAVKDATVSIYKVNDTTNVFDHEPFYFTKTNAKGEFILRNIKKDNYYIYAFEDKNKNLKLDTDKERYGYFKESLLLKDSITGINLHFQQYDIQTPSLKRAAPKGRYFEIVYPKAIVDYEIENTSSFDLKAAPFDNNRSLRVFKPEGFNRDSVLSFISVIDTIGMSHTDTLYIQFRDSKVEAAEFSMNNSYKSSEKILEEIKFKLSFSKPIKSYLQDSVFIYLDSGYQIALNEQDFSWNKHKTEIIYKKKVEKSTIEKLYKEIDLQKQKKREERAKTDTTAQQAGPRGNRTAGSLNQGFSIEIKKGAFVSIENDSSKNSSIKISYMRPQDYGTIKGEIIYSGNNFTIELLDSKDNIVKQINNEKQYTFRYVPPGEYRMRIKVDLNENGKWDPGHINEMVLPEPIIFYPEKLTIRANWELIDKNFDLDKILESLLNEPLKENANGEGVEKSK